MKLVGSLTSPYVRKVRVVLAEKKIDFEFSVISPWEQNSQVFKYSPLGKVPALVLDDGNLLFDSRVIVDYLDAVSPFNRLIPPQNRDKAEVNRWQALADGICDAAAAILLEKRRPTALQSADEIYRQLEKIKQGLEFAENTLQLTDEHPWCTGKNLSLADITVGCMLGFLEFRFPGINWQTDYPKLNHLYSKLIQRPSFASTIPVL